MQQSWSIKNFKDEFGVDETMRVLGCTTRMTVYNALNRSIRITLTDDDRLEAWEAKLVNAVDLLGVEE